MPTLVTQTPTLETLKQRQQATWASGDFHTIAALIVSVAERLVDAADLRAGSRVLDVATGSGNAAIAAARLGTEVAGVDYVPALLERGRQRAAAEGFEIDFVEGDAESLPYPDGSFDAVTSVFGSMFAPDHPRAAAELVRVSRPGGAIALASWTPEGFLGELFETVAGHVPPPLGLVSPMQWGKGAAPARAVRRRRRLDASPEDLHVPVRLSRGLRGQVRPLLRPDAEGCRGRRLGTRRRPARARPRVEPAPRRRSGCRPGRVPRVDWDEGLSERSGPRPGPLSFHARRRLC